DEKEDREAVMPGVTKEQIQQARETDLFAYLQFHEPSVLKRDGPNYRHREHDSLVYVTGKKYWYWNSRGRKINALDYLIEIRGYGLVDAVNQLIGADDGAAEVKKRARTEAVPEKEKTEERNDVGDPEAESFSLPWARRCAT